MIGPIAASAIRAAFVVGGEIARGAIAKARRKQQAKRQERPVVIVDAALWDAMVHDLDKAAALWAAKGDTERHRFAADLHHALTTMGAYRG